MSTHGVPNIRNWFKSTRSKQQGDCVEVGSDGNVVGVRDSKRADGDVLHFDRSQWGSFVHTLRTEPPA